MRTTCCGRSQLRDCIGTVGHIRVLAERAEAAIQKTMEDLPGYNSEIAGVCSPVPDLVTFALDVILETWIKIPNREPRMNVHPERGIAYGCLISFVQACLTALNLTEGRVGVPIGSDAVRGRVRRRLKAHEAGQTRFSIGR